MPIKLLTLFSLIIIVVISANATQWTVMVYMSSDNDLEPMALLDLQEMAKAAGSTELNVVVRIDRSAHYSSQGVLGLEDFTTARDLLIHNNNVTILKELGEVNMNNNTILSEFITFVRCGYFLDYLNLIIQAISNYPADHFALVLWNHGAGWLGFGQDDQQRKRQQIMTLSSITEAIEEALSALHMTKLTIIAYDACLMGNLESLIELSNLADYFVVSEELVPGSGFDYEGMLQDVGLSTTPIQFGNFILQSFVQTDDSPLTLALIDATRLAPLVESLDQFVAAVFSIGESERDSLEFALARARGVSLSMTQSPSEKNSYSLVDIGNFFQRLLSTPSFSTTFPNVASAVIDLLEKYNSSIISFVADRAMVGATGLTIYFPRGESSFSPYRSYYFAETSLTTWQTFLDAFTQSDTLASAANPTALTPIFLSQSRIDDSISYDAWQVLDNIESVSYSYLEAGTFDNNFWVTLLYTDAHVDYADHWIGAGFDGSIFEYCINNVCSPIYTSIWSGEDPNIIWLAMELTVVPYYKVQDGSYNPRDQIAGFAAFNFNITSFTFSSMSHYTVNGDGSVSQRQLYPGDVIVPIVPYLSFDGQLSFWSGFMDFGGLLVSANSIARVEVSHVSKFGCWGFIDLWIENVAGEISYMGGSDASFSSPCEGQSPTGTLEPLRPLVPPALRGPEAALALLVDSPTPSESNDPPEISSVFTPTEDSPSFPQISLAASSFVTSFVVLVNLIANEL